ncbi:MAG: hypothetical protein AXA67_01350 [Methylothermaceae bacteria B42]|nr:MAG: hypothetical protein AXA67_01350 [Methylothermaceae bacteria B42]HHJ39075.1 hypothetical protein [Methylothermaceae bacterium]
MKRQQSYLNHSNPYPRQNRRQPAATQTQHQYRRMCCNLFVAVLAVSGLISTQVAQAVSLPRNIVSTIEYTKLHSSTTADFFDTRAFDVNPAPHVTNQALDNNSKLVGTSYADAQGQWGNSANARFIDAGIEATSVYQATFTKHSDQDVLTTRISNTFLSLRDFGSSVQGDLEARFKFIVNISPRPSFTYTPIIGEVSLRGRAGRGFSLSGDTDLFTGIYTEEVSPVGTPLAAVYDLDTFSVEIPLYQQFTEIAVGDEFIVEWVAISSAVAQGGETLAKTQFWDPIGGTPGPFFSVGPSVSTVPVPAAIWLFGSGFLGLVGISARKRRPIQD